jgi:hypothetical protein
MADDERPSLSARLHRRASSFQERAARETARAVTRGALEGVREELPEVERVASQAAGPILAVLERLGVVIESRARELRAPGDRARIAGAGMVEGFARGLGVALPTLTEDLEALGPSMEGLARRVGAGLVAGMGSGISRETRRLAVMIAAGAALGAALLLGAVVRR